MSFFDRETLKRDPNALKVSRHRRVVLKIGIDTGVALVKHARSFQESHFIGVEIKRENAERAFDRVERAGLSNADIVAMDALDLMESFLAAESIDEIFVFFPTPYPAALAKIGFVRGGLLIDRLFGHLARNICRNYGSVRVVTDERSYFLEAERVLKSPHWWAVEWENLNVSSLPKGLTGTPCELRYRLEGKEIYALQAVKVP